MTQYFKIFAILLASILLLQSCKKEIELEDSVSRPANQYDYKIVHEWNDVYLEVERYAAGYRPGPTAVSLGYIGIANYEAIIQGMPNMRPISHRYSDLVIPTALKDQQYHWPTVVNSVNYFLYSRLFPEVDQKVFKKIEDLHHKNENYFKEEVSNEVYTRSANHGIAVAAAVWEWMKKDPVTFEAYKGDRPFEGNFFQTRTEKFAWQPTANGPGAGLFPLWGKAKTLIIKSDLMLCKHYKDYVGELSEEPNSKLYIQANDVYNKSFSQPIFVDQWIAEFWSDDILGWTFSPPARWLAIADQIYVNENVSLEKAIITNAKVGIALHDASIGCWNSKYHYNLERPESYIKRVIDPNYEPLLKNPYAGDVKISPSFPAYPSGHATFSAAASVAIESEFGSVYSMIDKCHVNRSEFYGMPRGFNSVRDMAIENGYSRVPLGVHFEMDSKEGVRYGTAIGREVVEKISWRR